MFSLLQQPHQIADYSTSSFIDLIVDENLIDYDIKFNYLESDRSPSTIIIDEIITQDNKIIIASVPEKTDNITTISIGSSIYYLAQDSDSLQPGEFIYDFVTKEVTVYLLPNDSVNNSNIVLHVNSLQFRLLNDCCDNYFSTVLQKWNPFGTFIISHSFGQEPSFAFTFKACADQERFILTELANGTIHEAFGFKWAIASLQITHLQNKQQIEVTVSCQHFYAALGTPSRSPLDTLIKRKKSSGNTYAQTRNLSEFTTEARVNYQGDSVSVRIPRSTSSKETTTVRQLLEERAIANHGFVYFNPNGVELRKWGQGRTHIINESDLRSPDITYSYNGHGSVVNGVKLHTEYRNLKVNLDFEEESESTGVEVKWAFENCESLGEMYLCAERFDWYLKEPPVDILRNPGINFDSGGIVKKATKTIYVNGTPTFQEEWRAGYAFSSDQVHDIEITAQGGIIIKLNTATFPQAYWQEVYHATSDWIYDDDGYLTEIRVSGTELARLQQESEKLEAVSKKAQAIQANGIITPDPSLMAQAEAYQFTENLPVEDTTIYQLRKHRDFYDDVVKPACEQEEDWVEPKFAARMLRSQENYFIKENPKNNEFFTYPPILSGKFFRETQDTIILSEDKYEVRNRKQNSEGEYFKNSRAEGNVEYQEGRPSTQTRLEREIPPDRQNNSNYERYKNTSYYLNSVGVSSVIHTEEGSKGYPDIDNPNQVRAIAETELSIINTQNACTTSIDIEWRSGVEVGDFALFQSKRWVILGIEDSRRIEQEALKSESFVLKLGLYLEPKLNLSSDCSSSVALIPITTYPTIPVPKNFWTFDNTLVDQISGKALTDGTYGYFSPLQPGVDYTYVTGKFNQAIRFNHYGSRMATNRDYDLVIGSDFSISAWVSRRGRIRFNHYSVNQNGSSASYYIDTIVHTHYGYTDIWFNSYEYNWYSNNNSSESSTSYNSASVTIDTADGEYRHIVITREYDQTSQLFFTKYYVDGEFIGQNNAASVLAMATDKMFDEISVDSKYNDPFGYLDNLRIYDRSLSAEEVQLLADE